MESIDTSGAAFVDFWGKVSARGDMNPNTAATLRAAARAVMEVEEGWEQLDVRTLDTERLIHRFANKASSQMKSASIRTYQNRFRQAIESFLKFADNPAAWRSPAQTAGIKTEKKSKTNGGSKRSGKVAELDVSPAPGQQATGGMIEYPYALRGGAAIARLRLPVDLTGEEVERLHVFLKAVAVS